MRRPATVLLAFAALFAPAVAAAATMQVAIDHTTKLAIRGPAASVVVGNPAVADVQVVDSHTVFVAGRSYGTTDVTVLDSLGRTIFSSDIEVAPPKHGRVAVYRGAARTDLACDPACAPLVTAAAPSAAAAPGSAATAASTAASVPQSLLPPALTGGPIGTPR